MPRSDISVRQKLQNPLRLKLIGTADSTAVLDRHATGASLINWLQTVLKPHLQSGGGRRGLLTRELQAAPTPLISFAQLHTLAGSYQFNAIDSEVHGCDTSFNYYLATPWESVSCAG